MVLWYITSQPFTENCNRHSLSFTVQQYRTLENTNTVLGETSGSDMPQDQSLKYPPLWARRQHARLSRSGPGFDPRSGQVSWVGFFRDFSSPVRQMSGNFRPPRSTNIICPSLSSIIHYARQWPEKLTRPNTSDIHTYQSLNAQKYILTCKNLSLSIYNSFLFANIYFFICLICGLKLISNTF